MQFQPLMDRRILLVEDEMLIAMDVSDTLSDAGASVTMAFKLSQAMALLNDGSSAFDGAVVDYSLPDGDCSSLCESLKAKSIPFVIYSGDGEQGARHHNVPVISKPASTAVLIAMLGTLVR